MKTLLYFKTESVKKTVLIGQYYYRKFDFIPLDF